MKKSTLLSALATILSVTTLHAETPQPTGKHTFSIEGRDFKIDGKPIMLLSGEMHYPRTPQAYWRDRLQKARAMGLNTICTYTFWNRHEPSPGQWDFKGDNDLVAFVKMCQEEGMFVMVRPGPYVCTEWDCGGIPGWTLADPDVKIRTNDPKYMKPAMEYVSKISGMMEPLSVANGGPVLMLQVENEYGSFGNDKVYLQAHVDAIRKGGWTGELFTSDGPTDRMIKGGTLKGITATMNFGGNAKNAFKKYEEYRPGQARMVGEFWVGWFDHWLKPHHSTSAASKAKEFDWMLANGVSANIYMFHGGTNFGYYAGANGGKSSYDSDTTTYDYSAVLSENGTPTDKFFAFKKVIQKHIPEATFGPMPKPIPTIILPEIKLTQSAHLFNNLPDAKTAEQPLKMEQLGQSLGFILYETNIKGPINNTLSIEAIQDRGQVYLDGKLVGILDRRSKRLKLPLQIEQGNHQLQILVENMGRVNFGHAMLAERKGLHGQVKLGDKILSSWKHYSLPLANASEISFQTTPAKLPLFKKGSFKVDQLGDAWLNMSQWGKGVVWVNGNNLGRFWSRGAQQSLYLPGCWLKQGNNEIVVLELELAHTPNSLTSTKQPIWEVRADDSLLTRKKGQNLDLSQEKPVLTGSFSKSDTWQTIKFKQTQSCRYVAIESQNAIDGKSYAAIAELEFFDTKGKTLRREDLTVLYADSEEILAESGSASNVIDNQPTTYWHTEWKNKSPAHPHAIVLDLGKKQSISGFRYLPRPEFVSGRIKDYRVFLSDRLFKGL